MRDAILHEGPIYDDLCNGLPVTVVTLQALIASTESGPIVDWASTILDKVHSAEQAHITDVLVSSGFDETGCNPSAFGILDPDYDGERIVAVVTAASEPETWLRITASGWESCDAPEGMPYIDLRGDVLADALETVAAGASLLLHPSDPQAWLSAKMAPQVITAAAITPPTDPSAGPGSIYAVVDPLNTTAVVTLFQVQPGPKISVRRAGAWVPDDGTLTAQLTGLNPPPVVAVATDQVPDVVRQVDDFDTTHSATAAGPNGGQAPQAAAPSTAQQAVSASALVAASNGDGHSDDVMVALPVHPDVAKKMAVGGGEMPENMHVTMAYLGNKADLPDHDTILKAAQTWASHTPAIKGVVSGPGKFTAGQDEPVHVALVDAPALPDARQDLVHHLEGVGASVNSEHGFSPHITIKYGGDPVDTNTHDLFFGHAALYYGDQVTKIQLQDPSELDAQEQPIAASMHHDRRIREAKDADSVFDADRAATDLAEQTRRRDFETMISSRYAALKADGHDESTASSTMRREIEAEDARRSMWEKQRSDALLTEKERRLRVQPEVRLSKDLTQHAEMAMVADAIPHTLLPPALFKYWVAGKGALKIRWNSKNDFYRCREQLRKYVHNPYELNGLCASLHKFATGRWTGSRANKIAEGGKL